MRMHGYDQLLGMRIKAETAAADAGLVAVDGFDVSRNFAIKAAEEILVVEEVTLTRAAER